MSDSFKVHDLHLHRSENQNARDIVSKAASAGVRTFGIVENVSPQSIKNDKDLREFINDVKDLPCLMGIQPAEPGWSRNFSPELIDQLDYVLMDAQSMPDGNKYGDRMEYWDHNCYVDDPEDFMDRNMKWHLKILNHGDERLDIFGWPLYLPLMLQREYYKMWSRERMEQIIEAARDNNVAFEINDLGHVPHPEFILMAKKAGCKFAFGSDTRDEKSFRLDYCKNVADLCGLTEKDFYVPVRRQRK